MRGGRTAKPPAKPGCPRVFLGCGPPRESAVTIDIEDGIALAVELLVSLMEEKPRRSRRLSVAPAFVQS